MSHLASDIASLSVPPYAQQDMPWPNRVYYGLSGRAWLRIGMIGTLMIALFWPNLRRLFLKTNPFTGEANWGHSFFVPLIGLYYLYLNRESLLKAVIRPGWLGLPIMLGGLLIFAYGIWPGQNDFVKDFGMVVTLFGVVALLCGWQVMKIAWFPIAFLVCGIPWPGLVYSYISSPLQRLAAEVGVLTLKVTGIDAMDAGTKIIMSFTRHGKSVTQTLNVAEACSGLRSLMTFVSVAAAVAFLSARPLWQKIIVVLSAIPIAIFCNVMRVAGQGLLDKQNHEWSQGFAHGFVGLVMMIPAFFLILLVCWLLDKIFIDEVEKKDVLQQPKVVTRRATVAPAAAAVVRQAPVRPAAIKPAAIPARPRPARPSGQLPKEGT